MRLYHYCCQHSARQITDRGFLEPNGREIFGVGLVWLTDQAVPDREGLGLTSHLIRCDRLERQYLCDVQPSEVERWLDSDTRARMAQLDGYEGFEDGRQPETWWIARRRIYAVRNRAYERAA